MVQAASLSSQLPQQTPQNALAHKPQHTFTQLSYGVEYNSCALPSKEMEELKEYHQSLGLALVLPHGPSRPGVGRQRKRKRGEREPEKRDRGPNLLSFVINLVHISYAN